MLMDNDGKTATQTTNQTHMQCNALIDESDSPIIQILCLQSQHFWCNDVNIHKLFVKIKQIDWL